MILALGLPEDREGLFDTITRSKNHYQKRAYQCIKCMVQLFSKCRPAHQLLHHSPDLKRKWSQAIDWLHDELDKVCDGNEESFHSILLTPITNLSLIDSFQRPYASTAPYTHAYNNWSPTAQSNDSANGYVLERSNSARKTLERACELCPDEEPEVEETSEECAEEAEKYQHTSKYQSINSSKFQPVTERFRPKRRNNRILGWACME